MSENRTNEKKPDFQPILGTLAKGISKGVSAVSVALNTAHDGMSAFKRDIGNALDKQAVDRFLNQYDKLIKAGLNGQEALDAVVNLTRQRLEAAVRERENQKGESQNDD